MPWKMVYQSRYSRFTGFLAFCALIQGYLWTGRLSLFWEDFLYTMANYYPMTIAMHRALSVLLGHLSWVVLGYGILRLIPRPQPFSNKWYTSYFVTQKSVNHNNNSTTGSTSSTNTNSTNHRAQWLWWTIGGYFVSSLFFNIADFINQVVLPVTVLEQASNSVVSQLIQPEYNDVIASIAGYIAPCLSAPWWEEVLYRGFLLPAIVLQNIPYHWATVLCGIIFSVHHLSPTGAIPLFILGWTWNVLYVKSGNLQTTILVHAMWNSRVFLGSWLGL
jgi:membrane protease YdiL (CAAX protease family)